MVPYSWLEAKENEPLMVMKTISSFLGPLVNAPLGIQYTRTLSEGIGNSEKYLLYILKLPISSEECL